MVTGVPMNLFLGPPTSTCLHCTSVLHINHQPVRVLVFKRSGPVVAQKIILKCKKCSINYRYDMYGGDSMGGYRYDSNVVDLTLSITIRELLL